MSSGCSCKGHECADEIICAGRHPERFSIHLPPPQTQSDVVTKYKAAAEICNSERCVFAAQSWPIAPLLAAQLCCSIPSRLHPLPSRALLPTKTLTEALTAVVDACKDGANVVELCRLGDETITK